MPETHTYNHSDIARYLQQQMTAEEMHSFERAMMDDPFLADALEGYRAADDAVSRQHLTQIEREILGAEEKAKVIPMATKSSSWFRVAALFILIAGVGFIAFYLMNDTGNRTVLAKNEAPAQSTSNDSVKPVEQPMAKQDAFPQNDLIAKNERTVSPVILQSESRQSNGVAAAEVSTAKDTAFIAMEDKAGYDSEVANDAKAATEVAPRALSKSSMNYQSREFRGRVMTPDGGVLPYANVRSNNNVNTMTDNNGNFTIKASDSIIDVNVTSPGYAGANKQIRSDAIRNEIVLEEAGQTLSEVVVVGMAAERKRAMASKEKSSQRVQANLGSAEPEGGLQSFQDYVYSSLKQDKDTSDNYITGDVLVEFTIDDRGKPKNITVAQPVNKYMAEKAVQLIQKGPKWKRSSTGKKAKVVIKF